MTRPLIAATLAAALTAGAAAAAPATFDTPEDAVQAMIEALEARDRDRLIEIFGPENEDVVLTGDPARDAEDWGVFYEGWQEMNRLAEGEDGRVTLYVGRDQWPFPVELAPAAEGAGWTFDAEAARDEILLRRIGRNELDVIDVARAYVRVQSAYRRVDYDGDGVMEFAVSVISSPDARDGLYWPPEPDAPESPIGDFMARAAAQGYAVDGEAVDPEPYLGYYFVILEGQGEAAPGGAYSYMVNGNMVAGHALLAVPAEYGVSGVMSFMIAENGVLMEADLGETTLETAAEIDVYDPADPWTPVED
jgi:hypothetical protein